MSADPLTDFSRLCLHTITTKPWTIEEATERYAAAGVKGVTVWRQWLEGRNIAQVGESLRGAGLDVVSLCRGGFFPATDAAGRQAAIDDNLKAIDEAEALGAPLIVLVCGTVPGQPLEESRKQIADGIAAVLDRAEQANVKLAIEPLHPMYADSRSAVNTLAQANDMCDSLDSPWVGAAGRCLSSLVGPRPRSPNRALRPAPGGFSPCTSAIGALRPRTCSTIGA